MLDNTKGELNKLETNNNGDAISDIKSQSSGFNPYN